MNEQELDELKKKLARWAADEVEHFNNDTHRHYRFGSEWYQSSLKREPDFPNDLNACFKWLVPKLYGLGFDYRLTGYRYHVATIRKEDLTYTDTGRETPALTLCLAIEKLIDGEREAKQ